MSWFKLRSFWDSWYMVLACLEKLEILFRSLPQTILLWRMYRGIVRGRFSFMKGTFLISEIGWLNLRCCLLVTRSRSDECECAQQRGQKWIASQTNTGKEEFWDLAHSFLKNTPFQTRYTLSGFLPSFSVPFFTLKFLCVWILSSPCPGIPFTFEFYLHSWAGNFALCIPLTELWSRCAQSVIGYKSIILGWTWPCIRTMWRPVKTHIEGSHAKSFRFS